MRNRERRVCILHCISHVFQRTMTTTTTRVPDGTAQVAVCCCTYHVFLRCTPQGKPSPQYLFTCTLSGNSSLVVGRLAFLFGVILLSELMKRCAWKYIFRALFDPMLHLCRGVYNYPFSHFISLQSRDYNLVK
jgi:hypothetical protein